MSKFSDFRKGDRFESLEDVEISVLTQWLAPATGGGKATLPRGQLVQVENDALAHASAVTLLPVHYDELHEHLVSRVDRENEKYSGYYLVIPFETLDQSFRRVE